MSEYYVSAGQTSTGIVLSYVDKMHVLSDGTANSTTVSGGGYFGSGGCMYISSGGVANSTTVEWYGSMYIFSGGVANDTTMSGGLMYVSGGMANDTMVNYYGSMYVCSGGVANSTTVNRGSMYVSSGGAANSTTVNYEGGLTVSSGGSASIVFNPWQGNIVSSTGAKVTYLNQEANVYLGTYYRGIVSKCNTLSGTKISGGLSAIIYSGGKASNTTVNDGYLDVSSGGVANDTTVNAGGMYVYSGGKASNTTVNDGYLDVSSGGVANDTTVNSDCIMYVSSGGKAVAIKENGGYVEVADGAKVSFVSNTFRGLELYEGCTLHSGTTAVNTTINGGYMDVFSGGRANSTMVNSCRSLSIKSGGVANSTIVNEDGNIYISSGGTANGVKLNNANATVSNGGMIKNVAVNSGSDLRIKSGGILAGKVQISDDAYRFSAFFGAIIDFTVAEQTSSATALINNWKRISGRGDAYYTITVKTNQSAGTYALAGGASTFSNSEIITVKTTTGTKLGTISANKTQTFSGRSYTLKKYSDKLILTIGALKLPDLMVSSLTPSASTINPGSSVKLSFTIKNSGVATAGASTAYVYSGSTKIGTVAVAALAAGKSKAYSYTVAGKYLAAGKNTLKIVADGANKVKESSESNNARTTTVSVKAADLTVSSLKSSASTVNPGSNVKLTFTIKNGGSLTAGASTSYVYSGSKKVGTVAVAALAAGKSKAYSYTVASKYLAAGKNTLKIVADGANKVKESNESNNSKTCSLTVKAADLTVASLTPSASTVKLGSNVKLSFTIKNTGSWSAGSSTAYVYSGSTKVGTVAVAALAAGKSKAYSYTVSGKYLASGKNTLKIVADGANKVKESSESNNAKACTVTAKNSTSTLTGTTKDEVFASGDSNDTIKCKGGDDIVCFGSNWGSDTVEQLDADEVTLWFKSGSLSKWNESTRTYSSGGNTIKVSGGADVSLKFGDDGSKLYDQLVAAGAFTTSNSKIIGTYNKGILATV